MHDWVRVPLTIQKVNVKVLKEERMDVPLTARLYRRTCWSSSSR